MFLEINGLPVSQYHAATCGSRYTVCSLLERNNCNAFWSNCFQLQRLKQRMDVMHQRKRQSCRVGTEQLTESITPSSERNMCFIFRFFTGVRQTKKNIPISNNYQLATRVSPEAILSCFIFYLKRILNCIEAEMCR